MCGCKDVVSLFWCVWDDVGWEEEKKKEKKKKTLKGLLWSSNYKDVQASIMDCLPKSKQT